MTGLVKTSSEATSAWSTSTLIVSRDSLVFGTELASGWVEHSLFLRMSLYNFDISKYYSIISEVNFYIKKEAICSDITGS